MDLATFNAFVPGNGQAQLWLPAIDRAIAYAELATPQRLAMWLAQCAHESQGFKRLTENMQYSAAGLLQTFPKYFDERSAVVYALRPVRIGSRVYANRMGNGDEASGDGYTYRGRGLIQLTGRANYERYSLDVAKDRSVLMTPDMVSLPHHAALSAAWFWRVHGCNPLADAGDFAGLTRRINGGLHGYDDGDRSDLDSRVDWLIRAKRVLGIKP